nr:alpha/beta hydrolase [Pseudaestuariivita rosea]
MIHCSLAHHGVWAGVMKALSDTHQMVAFDMPGHGRSGDWTGPGDYQTETTRIAASFCDGPVHLIGHSFGGTVALRLACEQPELVQRLSLIEPVFFAAARAAGDPAYDLHVQRFQPFVQAMDTGDHDTAARVFMDMWGARMPWDAMPEKQRQYIIDRVPLIPLQGTAIEDDTAGLLTSGVIEALPMPVDLIDGGQSQPVVGAILRALAQRIPHARRTTIRDAGHMAPITHPKQIAQILRDL